MDNETLLYTVLFAFLLIMAAFVLYRVMGLQANKRDEGVDLTVRRTAKPRYQLSTGTVYMLGASGMQDGLRVFRTGMSRGDAGLYVSRTFPDMARKRNRLGDTRCLWLSRDEKKGGTTPTALGPLLEEIEEFFEGSSRPFVFIADIDYLAEENDFERFFGFIKGLREVAESGGGKVLVVGTLNTLRKKEREQTHREVRQLGSGAPSK
jgi:hypothetical protein